jgi:hypothetical protein
MDDNGSRNRSLNLKGSVNLGYIPENLPVNLLPDEEELAEDFEVTRRDISMHIEACEIDAAVHAIDIGLTRL